MHGAGDADGLLALALLETDIVDSDADDEDDDDTAAAFGTVDDAADDDLSDDDDVAGEDVVASLLLVVEGAPLPTPSPFPAFSGISTPASPAELAFCPIVAAQEEKRRKGGKELR